LDWGHHLQSASIKKGGHAQSQELQVMSWQAGQLIMPLSEYWRSSYMAKQNSMLTMKKAWLIKDSTCMQ